VAAVSNVRFGSPAVAPTPPVSLDALPFPAALLDRSARLADGNRFWRDGYPLAFPGETFESWCGQLGDAAAAKTAAAGVKDVLTGVHPQFVQDYTTPHGSFRITVSRCGEGALVLHQDLCSRGKPNGGPAWQSHKMETVGRLVGGVAHDFANLVTLIAGYSELLLNRVGDKDPIRNELDEIRKAANRGAGLTAQLLTWIRPQSAQPQPVDLNAMISDIERMLRRVIGENVDLQTSLAPKLGKVMADPGQLEQVILNLILNARDAMPTGGLVRIETSNSEAADGLRTPRSRQPHILLSIHDTGHGIDAELLPHIFEPFVTTKENGKGTGLGLHTVHTIIKQAGGEVSVRSTPGQGTTFCIRLPRIDAVADPGQPDRPAEISVVGNETILLVEDEEGVRRLLTHVLRRRGYRVLEASNGEEALRLVENQRDIHVVLTDMVMPRMGGCELGSRVGKLRPDLPVIYMSGYTDDILVRTGALGPGAPFLQKPLRPEVLAAKLRETLDSASRPFNPR
jgi:two-component system cell cycle sensor histidine kinase/response regulator CckA